MIDSDVLELFLDVRLLMERENEAMQQLKRFRTALSRSVKGQTFAFLRVSAECISVDLEYTGSVYRDLGMEPHPLVSQLTGETEKRSVPWERHSELDADHLSSHLTSDMT
ncbi:hypothetical protein M3650_02590 [Paenibacillus sp. MER TA 81-3]|uniref:hypothetical protein n=1 Tax=Paenibacillus sp. MER TA 81-3 TaxID=2939573 RepID=UPI002041EDC5|nr:hypothetical protein [Paenibacillus sp. MER TA 81-3]MCM3337562.1 hypothetical protein [Paenibacillus sp. MER TA 81-3]